MPEVLLRPSPLRSETHPADSKVALTMMTKTAIALPYGWTISPRLTACWPIDDDHALELEPIERTDDHRIRWWYRLSSASNDTAIFEGDDVCSAVGAVVTTQEYAWTARCVLSWLTLRPGDVDADFFRNDTDAQTVWRDAHAEEMSIYTLDVQCGFCGGEDHISPACPRR
jgi:hypothetical protein